MNSSEVQLQEQKKMAGELPIAIAVPVMPYFAEMVCLISVRLISTYCAPQPVAAVPAAWGPYMAPEVWGIIAASNFFTVRQHVKWLPKTCCTSPCCVEQENTYSVYAGATMDSSAEVRCTEANLLLSAPRLL